MLYPKISIITGLCADLALAIALVSRWVGAAVACAKCAGENLSTVAVRWTDIVRILIRSPVPSFIFWFKSHVA